MKKNYPRNMIGYGSNTPVIKWPNNAKLALQLVLNYEEGSENCVYMEIKLQKHFYLKLLVLNLLKVDI